MTKLKMTTVLLTLYLLIQPGAYSAPACRYLLHWRCKTTVCWASIGDCPVGGLSELQVSDSVHTE